MAKDKAEMRPLTELRKQAEAKWDQEAMDVPHMSTEEVGKLVHELRTHQIELEMQNEELRRAQEELLESRDRYSDLYDFAPVGYVTVSHKGLILEANLTLTDMLGVERQALLRQPLSAFIIPDDQDRYYRHRRKLLDSKQRVTCQLRMIRRDAKPFWAEMDSLLDETEDESDLSYRAIISDISERKRSEDASRELLAIIESTDDAVVLERPDGSVVHWNTAAEKIYGYSREEMIGKSVTILDPPDRPDEISNMIKAIKNGEHFSNFETVRRRKDGSLIEVSATISPVKDENGNIAAIAAIVRDITELKETRELLQQAQKMEAIGQLTGGVAHDFNNLLAVIQGNAELLAEEAGTSDPMMQAIIRSTKRGGELTQRLLAYSRQQPLRPQSVDLTALTTGMLALLRRILGETIEIVTDQSPDLWPVLADPGQIENALLNLAINARDSMQDGGMMTIECMNVGQDRAYVTQNPKALLGDYVVMEVSDTGVGMADEVREHAFEPFFTTKKVGQGSGLGLSMIYGFAKQSGGHVTIDSVTGRGTTVRLYLPRASHQAEDKGEREALEEPRGNGEVVLVIEDDPDVRGMTVAMLDGLGYRALEAAEASSARALLANGDQVDLLLCDVVLPGGVSGPAFAEAAQRHDPEIKVIFMSGYAADAARNSSDLGSGSVLLNKPFLRAELAKVLRETLDR